MPFPVGHTLTGLIVAKLVTRQSPIKERYLEVMIIALLANIPDFDFILVWRLHEVFWHRNFTHSLSVALVLGALSCWLYGSKITFKPWLYFTSIIASHSLLDFCTTGAEGSLGIMLLWPFSDQRLLLGIISYPFHNWQIYRGLDLLLKGLLVSLIEFLMYGPFLLAIVLMRRRQATTLPIKSSKSGSILKLFFSLFG